jgi:hypothetical protein
MPPISAKLAVASLAKNSQRNFRLKNSSRYNFRNIYDVGCSSKEDPVLAQDVPGGQLAKCVTHCDTAIQTHGIGPDGEPLLKCSCLSAVYGPPITTGQVLKIWRKLRRSAEAQIADLERN